MNKDKTVQAYERENIYRLLSALCLRPPSDTLIDMIRKGSILSIFSCGEEGDSEDTSWRLEMKEFVKTAGTIPNLKEELEAEHTSLFVLPGGVLPHEAVYLDKEKRLGGRVTISVKQFYDKAGASILQDSINMPDHIGMELEFMSFLCRMEGELLERADLAALQECIRLQYEFLQEHLLQWVFQCSKKILELSRYGFYNAIAHLLTDFMEGEREYVLGFYTEICNNKEQEICETTT